MYTEAIEVASNVTEILNRYSNDDFIIIGDRSGANRWLFLNPEFLAQFPPEAVRVRGMYLSPSWGSGSFPGNNGKFRGVFIQEYTNETVAEVLRAQEWLKTNTMYTVGRIVQ